MDNTYSDSLLTWALWYAARGWPVFPCRPGRKAPATPHGFKDATTDPAVIARWWGAGQPFNIGIATGAPGPDVLDVDAHAGGPDGFAAWNRCKRAGLLAGAFRLVRTRSGAMHAYYAGTGRGCGSLPGQGLDFRARGGCVIAPPSQVAADGKGPAGRYVITEDRAATGAALDWPAIVALFRPPAPATVIQPGRHRRPWPAGSLPPSVLDMLDGTDPPDRSAAMFALVGACVRAGLGNERTREVVSGYGPAVEKYGPRLDAEIDRAIVKVAGDE